MDRMHEIKRKIFHLIFLLLIESLVDQFDSLLQFILSLRFYRFPWLFQDDLVLGTLDSSQMRVTSKWIFRKLFSPKILLPSSKKGEIPGKLWPLSVCIFQLLWKLTCGSSHEEPRDFTHIASLYSRNCVSWQPEWNMLYGFILFTENCESSNPQLSPL